MRVLVTGSRKWTDYGAICDALDQFLDERDCGLTIVHGACPTGADALASRWCDETFAAEEPHPADWQKHGRAAGPIRNQLMVDLGAHVCLAFPLGESRGTRDCMRRARAAGVRVVVVEERARD